MKAGKLSVFGLACFLLGVAGCKRSGAEQAHAAGVSAAPAIALKKAPDTPIENKKEELGGKTWDPAWDAIIEKDLPPALLGAQAARAVRGYCPRFAQLGEADKRAFWAYTFQALAGAEAGLDPTANVHHLDPAVNTTDEVTGRPSRQQGLLQLKYEDQQRYGCAFDWHHDRVLPIRDPGRTILNPERNLSCGVRIMEKQIIGQGRPLVERRSYWATLKPGTAGYRVFHTQMANVPSSCGEGALKPGAHRKHRRPESRDIAAR